MTKKLVAILLVGVLCLMGIVPVLAERIVYPTLTEYEYLTGKRIESFGEAPMLEVKVAAGELPRVEERLPYDPAVTVPRDEVGEYGGSLTSIWEITWIAGPWFYGLGMVSPDLEVVPNIAKGWEISEDGKTFMVYLREGTKWSNGQPFTADDFLFWYEDIILNDELTPVKPTGWSPGGELMQVEKVDDYTLRWRFATSFPRVIEAITGGWQWAPKHYLKRWHPKYNPDAQKLAEEEGYDHWWAAFKFHYESMEDPRPTLGPWKLTQVDSLGNLYLERNPYYWQVDTAGNQLPYIDRLIQIQTESTEAYTLKLMAGEFEFAGISLPFSNYPLYKQAEEKGDYRVFLARTPVGAEQGFVFNYTHKDPVLRKIFNDIRWRQAMSLAIDRDEMNQALYFGKGTPRQATMAPDASFYEDWMGEYYAEYDPEKANRLLDEMGLKWNEEHQWRLRPDGKDLAINFEYNIGMTDAFELVKMYWEKVGVKMSLKMLDRGLYQTRLEANEIDVGVWRFDYCTEVRSRKAGPMERFRPPWHEPPLCLGGVEWWNWYKSGGETGEEPPEIIKRLYELTEEWGNTLSGSEEYLRIGKEILTINLENLFTIGTVGLIPQPIMLRNDLKNSVRPGEVFVSDYVRWIQYQPWQWFFKSS